MKEVLELLAAWAGVPLATVKSWEHDRRNTLGLARELILDELARK